MYASETLGGYCGGNAKKVSLVLSFADLINEATHLNLVQADLNDHQKGLRTDGLESWLE